MRRNPPISAEREAWSYIAGEKGRNRVRVFQQLERGPMIYLDYRTEAGERVKRSLGHSDRDQAKREADDIAAKFGREEPAPPAVVTLDSLLKTYEDEVTPTKAKGTQDHDRRTFTLFREAFGADRRPDTLNVRDWQSYIARRRSGAIAPASQKDAKSKRGPGTRARQIEQDLKLLLAVLNWAERARDDQGGWLLDRNPLKGLEVPKESAPRRPVMSAELFGVVRTKAAELSLSAELFVCLLWFSGHRAASVRQLHWNDVDRTAKEIHWRAEVDKIGYDHRNPIHPELMLVLERAHAVAEVTGELTWIFPSTVDRKEPMTKDMAALLWRRIADSAGIKEGSRIGTHSFRRAFANRLRHIPLRELKDLGGWKTEQTVIGTYLQPDQDAQRTALEQLASTERDH
jgi:integrase